MRGREPSGYRGSENEHPSEERLCTQCRRELLERRLMLPASGVQHTRGRVQKHSSGRVDLWRGDVPSTAQPALGLVKFAPPDREATHPRKCGREYRPIPQPVALGEGNRLTAALARGRK